MRYLVTGCAGFIGFHLTRRLLREGHQVVGIDNLNAYYDLSLKRDRLAHLGISPENVREKEAAEAGRFTFIRAGLEEPDIYGQLPEYGPFDGICHLAAQAGVRYSIDQPGEYISSNIQAFFLLLEYCRHHPGGTLVFASSSSVYGRNNTLPYREEDNTDAPASLYAATKKSNELMAACYASLYGIRSVGLRFFTVYGPWGRPDMAPFLFTRAILQGEPVKVFNQGKMRRDFTYIDDIIEGVHRVLTQETTGSDHPARCRIYNIGRSEAVPLEAFIDCIEQLTGKKAERHYLPMQPGDVEETRADTSRLRQDYGYTPTTSIEAGMRHFIDWYTDYYCSR